MSDLLISQDGEDETPKIAHEQTTDGGEQAAGENTRQKRRQRKSADIPTEEDCLGAIAQVARLAAMGLLKPAQANSIRGSFRDILSYHQKKAKENEQGISNADVLDVFQQDPKLLSLLEPLLSQEQIDLILKNSDGGDA
ncbi:MAG: hypothetical protein H8E44_00950 [Planctomycetes bacterium]|nr:hypothetical protein [Planctomycetota bacterium]